MNAWGDEPLLQLASALHKKSGDRAPPTERAPADGDLDNMATIDAEFVETDVGTVVFPPRPDMRRPLVDLLRDGPLSSQTIEDALAKRFCVTEQMRAALLQSNCPAWRNHVAWVLVDLGRTGTGKIERIESKPRPGGGSMGIYRLMSADEPNILI